MKSDWKVDTYQSVWGLFAGDILVPFLLAGKPDPLILLRDLRAIDRLLVGPWAGSGGEDGSRVYIVYPTTSEETRLVVYWIDPKSNKSTSMDIGHIL